MSLINFNKETVQKTVDELGINAGTHDPKNVGGSEASTKLENFKQMQDELDMQTSKL